MMGQEPTGLPEMNVRYTNINRVPLGFEYTDEIERSNKFYFNHGLTEYGKSKIQIDQVDWREVYENAGADWINDLQPSQFAQEFAKQLVKERKKSILEVGCANGKDSILFALAGLNVTGIDIIPEVIEIARQNAEKVGLSIDFRVENVEELTFSDSSFDAVFSVSTLHSTDMNKSIPKISKVLKTKGLAFIYIYSDTQHINGQREEFVTLDEFIDLFKNNGFSIENLYTEQEEEYDNAGEKHNKIIVNARKE
jgi:2-polyprenyl-3-methyl-5-hydroxy-6-metoxy-1,4-benzoquinol methylase